MKILYAATRYDYGIPERGFSFEHYNFYETLVKMGHDVEYFDFVDLHRTHGSVEMTKLLADRVREGKPDLLFTFLFTDQFHAPLLKKIKEESSTVTFNWFADDHWRFESFSRHWAECFSFVSTTDIHSLEKYHSIGYGNALLTQWGVNHYLYTNEARPMQHDVSFIGQAHGDRRTVVNTIQSNGIDLLVKGTHWNLRRRHMYAHKLGLLSANALNAIVNETRISQDAMIDIFRSSRINLNLTASSQTKYRNQIKGRNFEIPGCGGFQLSEYADRIEEYFVPDKEIVCFRSTGEMIEKIQYYLQHEEERKAVADAGYQRAMKDHTYEQRFRSLFHSMGLE
jgi:spore maturation protein CgeB